MTNAHAVVGKNLSIVMEKISNFVENMVMKNSFLYMSLFVVAVLTVVNINCKNSPTEPEYPVYNYLDPIINPPDVFQVIYNISFIGDRFAEITFENNAVWLVQKLGDGRIMFFAKNDTSNIIIESADTLGLKAGVTYIFGANNNNYEEFNNFFAQFNKLAIDYDSFEPKF